MRVAVVVNSLHGGLLHYAVQMADGLAARGHTAEVLAPRGNELASHDGPSRMRAVLAPTIRTTELPRARWRYQLRRAAVALRLVRSWARVNLEARRGYDAIVVGEDLALAVSAVAVGALTVGRGPKVAVVCHNVRPFNRWSNGELFESSSASLAPLRLLYPRCDVVFVHGERSRQEFEATWPASNLAVIPHGDERIFGAEPPPPADAERILFFGDWRKVKGLGVLMDAFDRLVARRPSARLTIAGTPAPNDYDPDVVLDWARRHGERVEVIAQYVPREEVRSLFGSARLVCTPYLVGYQSGVVHLAQTMARAVVTTDVGDLPAAVGPGGRVVAPGDADALADALEELLADPELAVRLGREGHGRVSANASWETVGDLVVAALEAA